MQGAGEGGGRGSGTPWDWGGEKVRGDSVSCHRARLPQVDLPEATLGSGAVLPDKGAGRAQGFIRSGSAALQPWGEFAGSFTDGLPHGHGVVTLSDGGRWEGQFRQGYVSGTGAFMHGDVVYKGNMALKDGQLVKHGGWGTWTRAGHATVRGFWEEDQLMEGEEEQAADAAAEVEAIAQAAEASAEQAAQAARERAEAGLQAAAKAAKESSRGGGGQERPQTQEGYISRCQRLRNLLSPDSPHLQKV